MSIEEFLETFKGHLTFYMPKDEAEKAVAMGREASDRYERIKMFDIYLHFNKGQSLEKFIEDLNAAGYIWFDSKYFERPSHVQ